MPPASRARSSCVRPLHPLALSSVHRRLASPAPLALHPLLPCIRAARLAVLAKYRGRARRWFSFDFTELPPFSIYISYGTIKAAEIGVFTPSHPSPAFSLYLPPLHHAHSLHLHPLLQPHPLPLLQPRPIAMLCYIIRPYVPRRAKLSLHHTPAIL